MNKIKQKYFIDVQICNDHETQCGGNNKFDEFFYEDFRDKLYKDDMEPDKLLKVEKEEEQKNGIERR